MTLDDVADGCVSSYSPSPSEFCAAFPLFH